MTQDELDDLHCAQYLSYMRSLSGMSSEGLESLPASVVTLTGVSTRSGNHVLFGGMDKIDDGIRAITAKMLEKSPDKAELIERGGKMMFRANNILFLTTVAVLAAAVCLSVIKLLKIRDASKEDKAVVLEKIRKELEKISKPGFKVSVVGGTDTKVGTLTVNGKPASQIRTELDQMIKSDKSLTPEEYQRCVKVVAAGGEEFLSKMDQMRTELKHIEMAQTASTVGLVFLWMYGVVVTTTTWLGYRIYMYLARKLS